MSSRIILHKVSNKLNLRSQDRKKDFQTLQKTKRSHGYDLRRKTFVPELAEEQIKTTISKSKLATRKLSRKVRCPAKKVAERQEPLPFVVGKVRHKIYSPPFLHQPVEYVNERKNIQQTPLQSFAPQNYKFKPPKGLKMLMLSPKVATPGRSKIPVLCSRTATPNKGSPFTLRSINLKGVTKSTKKIEHSHPFVTLRSRSTKKQLFFSPLKTDVKTKQIDGINTCSIAKKHLSLNTTKESIVFGRLHVAHNKENNIISERVVDTLLEYTANTERNSPLKKNAIQNVQTFVKHDLSTGLKLSDSFNSNHKASDSTDNNIPCSLDPLSLDTAQNFLKSSSAKKTLKPEDLNVSNILKTSTLPVLICDTPEAKQLKGIKYSSNKVVMGMTTEVTDQKNKCNIYESIKVITVSANIDNTDKYLNLLKESTEQINDACRNYKNSRASIVENSIDSIQNQNLKKNSTDILNKAICPSLNSRIKALNNTENGEDEIPVGISNKFENQENVDLFKGTVAEIDNFLEDSLISHKSLDTSIVEDGCNNFENHSNKNTCSKLNAFSCLNSNSLFEISSKVDSQYLDNLVLKKNECINEELKTEAQLETEVFLNDCSKELKEQATEINCQQNVNFEKVDPIAKYNPAKENQTILKHLCENSSMVIQIPIQIENNKEFKSISSIECQVDDADLAEIEALGSASNSFANEVFESDKISQNSAEDANISLQYTTVERERKESEKLNIEEVSNSNDYSLFTVKYDCELNSTYTIKKKSLNSIVSNNLIKNNIIQNENEINDQHFTTTDNIESELDTNKKTEEKRDTDNAISTIIPAEVNNVSEVQTHNTDVNVACLIPILRLSLVSEDGLQSDSSELQSIDEKEIIKEVSSDKISQNSPEVIELLDSPTEFKTNINSSTSKFESAINDYKLPIGFPKRHRSYSDLLKAVETDVIVLSDSDNEDSTTFLSRIRQKYGLQETLSPKRVPMSSLENLSKLVISPSISPLLPKQMFPKDDVPIINIDSPMRVLSLRSRTVNATPSPQKKMTKKVFKTPNVHMDVQPSLDTSPITVQFESPAGNVIKLRNRTVIETPSPQKSKSKKKSKTIRKEDCTENLLATTTCVASPLRVQCIRNEAVNITPSPRRGRPKKTVPTVCSLLQPEDCAVRNSPPSDAIASPMRVMSLRNRQISVSPSPQKITPRGCRKGGNRI